MQFVEELCAFRNPCILLPFALRSKRNCCGDSMEILQVSSRAYCTLSRPFILSFGSDSDFSGGFGLSNQKCERLLRGETLRIDGGDVSLARRSARVIMTLDHDAVPFTRDGIVQARPATPPLEKIPSLVLFFCHPPLCQFAMGLSRAGHHKNR